MQIKAHAVAYGSLVQRPKQWVLAPMLAGQRGPFEPMGRAGLALVAFLGIAVTAQFSVAEESSDVRCNRPELVWTTWRDHVLQANPGVRFIELEGAERAAILRALECWKASSTCPPDHSVVFHCTGRRLVLIAFVKGGCVTKAEEMSIERFMDLFGQAQAC